MSHYVDPKTLANLFRSTSGGAGSRFVKDFVRMWDIRVARLTSALDRRDFDDADVVLLSIRSGSTMLGAAVLEAIAGMIHLEVKRQDVEASRVHLRRLVEVGHGTCVELEHELADYEAGHPSSEAASR